MSARGGGDKTKHNNITYLHTQQVGVSKKSKSSQQMAWREVGGKWFRMYPMVPGIMIAWKNLSLIAWQSTV